MASQQQDTTTAGVPPPKLSEIIARLQAVLDEKGDLPVKFVGMGVPVTNYDRWERCVTCEGNFVSVGRFCELGVGFGDRPGSPVSEKAKVAQRRARLRAYAAALAIPPGARQFTYSHGGGLVLLRNAHMRTFTATYTDVFRFEQEDSNLCIARIECDREAVVCLGDHRHYMQRVPALLAHVPTTYSMEYGDHFGIPHCDLRVVSLREGARIRVQFAVWSLSELARLRAASTTHLGVQAGVTVTFGRAKVNAKTGREPDTAARELAAGTGYSPRDGQNAPAAKK